MAWNTQWGAPLLLSSKSRPDKIRPLMLALGTGKGNLKLPVLGNLGASCQQITKCCKATCRLPISATVLVCPRIKVLLPICSSCFTLWSSLMNQYIPIRAWLMNAYLCIFMQSLPKLDGLLGKITPFDAISGSPIPENHLQCLAGPKLPESLLDAINGIIAQVLVLSSVSWFSWSI